MSVITHVGQRFDAKEGRVGAKYEVVDKIGGKYCWIIQSMNEKWKLIVDDNGVHTDGFKLIGAEIPKFALKVGFVYKTKNQVSIAIIGKEGGGFWGVRLDMPKRSSYTLNQYEFLEDGKHIGSGAEFFSINEQVGVPLEKYEN